MEYIKTPTEKKAEHDEYLLKKDMGRVGMVDSQGNKIRIGTKLRSTSKWHRKEIVCISLNREFGMFKELKQFRGKAISYKITKKEMAGSCWVDAEKMKGEDGIQ